MRTAIPRALAILLLFGVAGCGGGGGGSGGSNGSMPLSVNINDPASPNVSTSAVELDGTASCDACPPSEFGFGFCPAIKPTPNSAIQVAWSNRTTGTEGLAFHGISSFCACVFSNCVRTYSHRWLASIPLAIGDNVIEVRASNSSGASGLDSVTVTRLPFGVTGLVAAAGKGQVTLSWDPVAGATSYNLYWATSRNVSPSNGTRISGLSSPFTHTGLSNDVTYYYTVSAVIGAVESVPSGVAWATAGWLTADVAATSPTTSDFATSIATDSMGGAHVHYSFDEHIGNAVLFNNYYATNVPGPWSKLLVARTVWVSSSIALESGGTAHVGYQDFGGLKHAIYTAGTWIAEVADATGTCEASLALDSAGKVHIAYYSSAGGKTLRYVTNASGSWASSDIESFASIGCYTPHKVSLGVDATGVAHVAYAGDSPDYGLKYATNSGGTWTISTLDTGNINQVSLAVDLNARVHIAYANNLNQLKYAQNATGAWIVEVLGGLKHPALALDAGGKAHVSYIGGPSGGELTYATNAGGSWRTIPIDTANNIAVTDTAIAVDPQGKVHISYIRGSGIKYATNK